MSEAATIYELIPKVMADIGAIGKNSQNAQQGFKFRGIEAVVNGISTSLIKHGVFYSPITLSADYGTFTTSTGKVMRTCVLEVQYRFFGPQGDHFDAVVFGESSDMGDKSTSKAISMAQKYALANVFNITTQDMEDSDATTIPEGNHSASPRPKPATRTQTVRKPPTSQPAPIAAAAAGTASEPMRRTLLNRATKAGIDDKAVSAFVSKHTGKELDDADLSVDDVNKLLGLLSNE